MGVRIYRTQPSDDDGRWWVLTVEIFQRSCTLEKMFKDKRGEMLPRKYHVIQLSASFSFGAFSKETRLKEPSRCGGYRRVSVPRREGRRGGQETRKRRACGRDMQI